jgi:hypothetical protein
MYFYLDTNFILWIFSQSPFQVYWYLFINGGWIIVVLGLMLAFFYGRLFLMQIKYLQSIKYNLLAIDIPKDNEQSILAVEQMFAQLHGIKSSPTKLEKYWLGQSQLSFSLEIISIEGYIQFLIRTPEKFRDLVEAAVYAQYPEAEIVEVEDYVKLIPNSIKEIKEQFNLFGIEFTLEKDSCYPIRTFRFFEYGLDQVFIDPMASLLETMSKIGKGEQIGLQLIIAPANDDWKGKGYKIINKLIGAKVVEKDRLSDKLIKTTLSWMEKFSEMIYQLWGDIKEKDKTKNEPHNLVQFLTGGEKNVLEGIQNKLSKLSFGTTLRYYYLAQNEVFKKGLGANSMIGAINQFNTSDMNCFKKFKKLTTHADYFFIQRRIFHIQKKLIRLYKNRSRKGSKEFFLSTEELATIFHFPTISVKTPLLKRTEWKKAVPPGILPTEKVHESTFLTMPENELPQTAENKVRETNISEPPLPINDDRQFIINESLPDYNFDNKFYEKKFTKQTSTATPTDKNNIEPSASTINEEPPSNLPIID